MTSVTSDGTSLPDGPAPAGASRHPGGRRSGSESTRQAILDAAIKLFAEHGYAASSLRAITSEAGVDVAMVKHFFGGKQGLFDEAILRHADRMESALELDTVPTDEFPERFAQAFLKLWETEPTASTFIALIRSGMESTENRDHLEAALQSRLFPIMQRLLRTTDTSAETGAPPATNTTPPLQLLGGHLLGIGIARYVLRLAPIAELPAEAVASDIAATVRRYLPTTH
ncbi:MAG: TetR/AcrR family transcriptional regulator [Galactobacter sp.]